MRWHPALVPSPVVAMAACALLAVGCSGGGSPGVASIASSTARGAAGSSATASSQTHALLVVGQCLRQHGIPNAPDPTIATSGPAQGQVILDKAAFRDIPSSVLSRAMLACQIPLEKAGIKTSGGPNAGASPQQIQYLLAFARCVRDHGFPNFPDPNSEGGFDLAGTGINPDQLSPAQLSTATTCLPTAHGALQIPPQVTGASAGGQ
jgi:hypothetical protein